MFDLLHDWIDEERQPWPHDPTQDALRRRHEPDEDQPEHGRLAAARAVDQAPAEALGCQRVAAPWTWSYFGDHQIKLTQSYRPERWLAEAPGPDRDERTRQALAEAVALVAYYRSSPGRRALARAVGRKPALDQPWLRTLVTRLNSGN